MARARTLPASIAKLKYNQLLLTTPMHRYHTISRRITVGTEQFTLEQLGITEPKIEGRISDCSTELMTLWLRFNVGLFSPEVQQFWGDCVAATPAEAATLIASHTDILRKAFGELLKMRKSLADGISASTLYLRVKPTFEAFVSAWMLASGKHKFATLLQAAYTDNRGTSWFCFHPELLIDVIDFPITSISNMIGALGYAFDTEQPMMDQGRILSYSDKYIRVYYQADESKFKTGTSETIASLINNDLIEPNISARDANELGIVF